MLFRSGVAGIGKIADGRPESTANDVILSLKQKNGRWIVGTDAWFFKEGTATKWQAARFGQFRVGPNGTMLLVNLADADLNIIR